MGKTIVNGTLELNYAGGNHTVGLLEINSGGTFKAGSGTITATGVRNLGGSYTQG